MSALRVNSGTSKQKHRRRRFLPYQSPPRLIVKNRQASAIKKRTMANRPAPITKKILLSSALGGASSVEPTTTAEDPISPAKASSIQKPFKGWLCFIFAAANGLMLHRLRDQPGQT